MGSTVKQLDYSGENSYVGLDTHWKNWKSTVLVGNTFFKTFSQDSDAEILLKYVRNNFSGGTILPPTRRASTVSGPIGS